MGVKPRHDYDDEAYAYVSSGNVFADSGLPGAAEVLARSQLMEHLMIFFRERKLTEEQVAELLGTTQPVVADLMGGKLQKFSISQLFLFLEALGHDVEITVHPRKPMRKISLRRAKAAH